MNLRKGLLFFSITVTSLFLLVSIIGIFAIGEVSSTLFFTFLSLFFLLLILICVKKIKNPEEKVPEKIKILLPILFFLSILSIVTFEEKKDTDILIKENNILEKNDTSFNNEENKVVIVEKGDKEKEIAAEQILVENGEEKTLAEIEKNKIQDSNLLIEDDKGIVEKEILENINEKASNDTKNLKPNSSRQVIENPTIIEKASVKNSVKVYIGSKGKKFHKKTCRTLKTSATLTELTVSDAKTYGYSACKVCNPPEK